MSYTLRSKKSYAEEIEALAVEFDRWGVRKWSLEPQRVDGRKSWWSAEEVRVTVRFEKNGQTIVLSMADQERPVDNLRVLTLGIEAIRLNEVRGIGQVMREAYLQIAGPRARRDPYEVLGVLRDSDVEVVRAVYLAKAKKLHPDVGGDPAAFAELQEAYDALKVAS